MSAKKKANPVRYLAQLVRKSTGGGKALVEFLEDVCSGLEPGVTVRDRLEAAKILLERGWGKAGQELTVSGQVAHVHVAGRIDLSRLSDAELAQARAALAKAALPAHDEEEDAVPDAEFTDAADPA